MSVTEGHPLKSNTDFNTNVYSIVGDDLLFRFFFRILMFKVIIIIIIIINVVVVLVLVIRTYIILSNCNFNLCCFCDN